MYIYIYPSTPSMSCAESPLHTPTRLAAHANPTTAYEASREALHEHEFPPRTKKRHVKAPFPRKSATEPWEACHSSGNLAKALPWFVLYLACMGVSEILRIFHVHHFPKLRVEHLSVGMSAAMEGLLVSRCMMR